MAPPLAGGGTTVRAAVENVFFFEGYTLDLTRGCLRVGSREVALRPKSFAVLCYLLENAGRLVSKEELLESVWDNASAADESVARCVSDVRLALGDADQRLIKTVMKRGYMFVAPVSRRDDDNTMAGPRNSRTPSEAVSLIVLPFANLREDAAYDCFGDGITEGLTSYLSRIPDSFVIARSTAIAYQQHAVDVRQIGRELDVRYMLAGRCQHAGKRVRVSAQLIDARTGAHLWADQFDTSRTELLDLQDNIVTRLARAIQIELAALEATRISRAQPTRADAEGLARRGEAVFLKYGPNRDETESGYELCERALAVDPANARALSILAEKFATRVTASQSVDRDGDMRCAAELISRALASDPESFMRTTPRRGSWWRKGALRNRWSRRSEP
jgi:adenylate cyclase